MGNRRAWNWIFGSNARIDFDSGVGVAGTITYPPTYLAQGEGCDTVSDPNTGALLFHTNGSFAYDASFNDITPSGGVAGSGMESNLAMQAICVVKAPGSSTLYYLFFVGNWGTSEGVLRDIRYRTLDVNGYVWGSLVVLDTPSGGVGYAENLTAAIHANGTDWWIITKMKKNNIIRIWPLTSSGVGSPISRTIGFITGGSNRYGQIKVSPSGKRLALGLGGLDAAVNNDPVLTVWTFDNSNASLSNERILLTGDQIVNAHSVIGVDFSPNSSVIFASSEETPFRVYKAILWSETCHSLYHIDSTSTRGATQLGPDGRIYIASAGNEWVGRITSPDNEESDISIGNFAINNNNAPGGVSTSAKGLPVVPQMLDTIKDYRVFYNGVWHSVCNGDVIKFYDELTAQWHTLAVGDRYYANGVWETISCNLIQQKNYTCVDIVGFNRPEDEGYDPPYNSSSYTLAKVALDAPIGAGSQRIIGPLYEGIYPVLQVTDNGPYKDIIFATPYIGSNTTSKFVV